MARNSTTWKPGHCPNPGGRPKVVREIRDLAQTDAAAAYARVKAIMEDPEHKQALAAALAILKVAGVPMSEDKAAEPAQQQAPIGKGATTEDLMAAAVAGEG